MSRREFYTIITWYLEIDESQIKFQTKAHCIETGRKLYALGHNVKMYERERLFHRKDPMKLPVKINDECFNRSILIQQNKFPG